MNRIINWDPKIDYKKGWYELHFDKVNSSEGIYRAKPLPVLEAQNKVELRALTMCLIGKPDIKNFAQVRGLLRQNKIRLVYKKIVKGIVEYKWLID